MLSSTEGVIPSPPTTRGRGWNSCLVWGWKGDIPLLFRVFQGVLTWEYHRLRGPMLPLITIQSSLSQMYIAVLLIASLRQGITSACSHDANWNRRWAPSNLLPCPLSPKQRAQVCITLSITFLIHMSPPQMQHQSIRTSIVTTSRAPGALSHSRAAHRVPPSRIPGLHTQCCGGIQDNSCQTQTMAQAHHPAAG